MTRHPPMLIDGRMVLLKITATDGSPLHGGSGRWPLPTADGPGEWWTVEGELVPCESGLHLIESAHLAGWLIVDAVVWEAETDGEILRDSDKLVARKARLVRKVGILDHRTLARFAADCAERVLPLFEAAHPGDSRSRQTIKAARRWFGGRSWSAGSSVYTAFVATSAATSAAYAATSAAYAAYAAAAASTASAATDERISAYAAASASCAAAYAAAYAASAAPTAAYAARAAADYAATAAAHSSTSDAAERTWQGAHLLELLAEQDVG